MKKQLLIMAAGLVVLQIGFLNCSQTEHQILDASSSAKTSDDIFYSTARALGNVEVIYNNQSKQYRSVLNTDGSRIQDWTSGALMMDAAPMPTNTGDLLFVQTLCQSAGDGFGLHQVPFSTLNIDSKMTCRKIQKDPYLSPLQELPLWGAGTRAKWASVRVGNKVYSIGFDENKTMTASNGQVRRGHLGPQGEPRYQTGYVAYNRKGTPLDPANISGDSLFDGYYMGFITLSAVDLGNFSPPAELGPIVWPKQGYRKLNGTLPGANKWQETSTGFRHPKPFVENDYLYLFFAGEDGIYSARTKITELHLNRFYCGTSYSTPCLPSGFDVSSAAKFEAALSLSGNSSAPLLPVAGAVSLSVSKTTSGIYAGVLQTHEAGVTKTTLLKSTDLLRWETLQEVEAVRSTGDFYGAGLLLFPQFVDARSGNPYLIDEKDFFLVGTQSSGCSGWPCKISRIRYALSVSPTPPTTPSPANPGQAPTPVPGPTPSPTTQGLSKPSVTMALNGMQATLPTTQTITASAGQAATLSWPSVSRAVNYAVWKTDFSNGQRYRIYLGTNNRYSFNLSSQDLAIKKIDIDVVAHSTNSAEDVSSGRFVVTLSPPIVSIPPSTNPNTPSPLARPIVSALINGMNLSLPSSQIFSIPAGTLITIRWNNITDATKYAIWRTDYVRNNRFMIYSGTATQFQYRVTADDLQFKNLEFDVVANAADSRRDVSSGLLKILLSY